MADSSDRIIVLSALILVVIIVWISIIPPIVSLSDIQIELETDRELYFINETFSVKVFFYNENPYAIRINTNIDYDLIGYTLERESFPAVLGHGYPTKYSKIPPYSSIEVHSGTLAPRYSGEFLISCLGVNKTLIILYSDSEGEKTIVMMNKPIYSNTETATLIIGNSGLNIVSFGTPYEIRIKDNGFWTEVYPSPYPSAFLSIRLILEPGEVFRQQIKIDTLEPGQYRIRKEVFDETNRELISLVVKFRIQELPIQNYSWVTATVLDFEPSPTLEIVDLSSDDEDIPRSLFTAIDKAILDAESVQEERPSTIPGENKRFAMPVDEAESIIRYFGEEIEEGRNAYEFYVRFLDYVISILIQFSLPFVTS